MKHYIIAKFKPEITREQQTAMLPDIAELFGHLIWMDGINNVDVWPNCVDRENRYDLMIEIDLEKEAPGPVVGSTEEIISSIRSDDCIYDEKRRAFVEKYLTYENAESSKKIFEEVFIKGSTNKKVRTREVIIKAVRKLLPKKAFRYLRNRSMKS